MFPLFTALVLGQCPPPPVYWTYEQPIPRVVRLEKVAAREVKPMIVITDEIRTTVYINATMPDGKSYRVPVVNDILPDIKVGYENGVAVSLEYHFDGGTPGNVKADASFAFTSVPGQPAIEESGLRVDQFGGLVQETTYRYTQKLYRVRVVKNVVVDDSPDAKLKRPSQVPR